MADGNDSDGGGMEFNTMKAEADATGVAPSIPNFNHAPSPSASVGTGKTRALARIKDAKQNSAPLWWPTQDELRQYAEDLQKMGLVIMLQVIMSIDGCNGGRTSPLLALNAFFNKDRVAAVVKKLILDGLQPGMIKTAYETGQGRAMAIIMRDPNWKKNYFKLREDGNYYPTVNCLHIVEVQILVALLMLMDAYEANNPINDALVDELAGAFALF
jgi:hypothetical protein